MARLVDFSDIRDRVREELGISTNDDTLIDRIDREINIVYEHEVVPFKRWKWLQGHTDVVHKAYYHADTCSVTPNSTTVTLSTAPGATWGSFKGWLFSVDGFDEIYEIAAHTSQSTTVTLTSAYQGAAANSTASFKIWRDKIDLPTDARETVDLWHNRGSGMMMSVGNQDIRQKVAGRPKSEGFPSYYSTLDFYDSQALEYYTGTCAITNGATSLTLSTAPASTLGSFAGLKFKVNGTSTIYTISSHTAGSTSLTLTSNFSDTTVTASNFVIWESEEENRRYRQVRIFPSLVSENVTVHIDYTKEIAELIDDTDEPVMPREDRMVLVYGTLAKLWASIRRNPEEAARNQALYDRKLSQMAGRIEDSFDTPKLRPTVGYVRAQRSRLGVRGFNDERSSASGFSPVTYLEDVTINGAAITNTVTVSSGITIDGRDISVDGTTLDTLAARTKRVEYRTLTSDEATNKALTLANTPQTASKVMLDVIGGGAQEYTTDYSVSSTTLSWGGLGLDGVLTAGDVLRIHYWS